MAYEYEGKLLDYASGSKTYEEYKAMSQELKEVYRKAKILDEVKNFTTERLKEQKHTDEYDFGERLMCEEIEEIIGGQIND
ncbi:hypothetical protein [Staphylococcus saprophyticus]|uniref:hypothetical protein n=1 Tax=Staphylococcus saprophyticus TaxID=29385 RepID=UPI00076B0534|nr:hypothetical protein [Staphylococcus saprophyticus]AMG20059.1 hypothetical protein AL528_07620 [Staphylococcus saprophyticus]MDW3828443.1 hypothetical protein [Staphylococcus saprophyticus]MDW4048390.1 hypothetical protein [Staphylococcus saprophyticus]MDW4157437.1 hypothetical protein [Staphylococcus saprophyticus]